MMMRIKCSCGRFFSSRLSISRHYPSCVARSCHASNNNVLLSQNIALGSTNEYKFEDYELESVLDSDFSVSTSDNDSFSSNSDNLSASIPLLLDVKTDAAHYDSNDVNDDSYSNGGDVDDNVDNNDYHDDDNSNEIHNDDSDNDTNDDDDDDIGGSHMSISVNTGEEYSCTTFSLTPNPLSAAFKMQIQMNEIFDKNKASLCMYDDIISLFNDYVSSPEFSRHTRLNTRKQFMAKVENMFNISNIKPSYGCVQLTDNTLATVPVFEATAMILSILHDPSIMCEDNFAAGYNIFTGNVDENHPANKTFGEIHTGDAWVPALHRYCGRKGKYMPFAMVVFGDKSHTDLHGALSVEPVSFTPTFLNRKARNLPQFWRLLGYIPNLTYGRGGADQTSSTDKIQNVHNCLSYILKSLREINKRGGIKTTVMGKRVHIKVWIHFLIGDTEGNNKWLGHYPGNNSGTRRPYRDCQCEFHNLSNPNPTCIYTTMQEMADAQSLLKNDRQAGMLLYQTLSRHPIRNALTEKGLPLSDALHGPFRMTPPELLHTSGAGLILYIFRVIADQIGAGIGRNDLDEQHLRMTKLIRRQSERDFPRAATRNGIVDGTKCQASERRGNLFSLLCIVHTKEGHILKELMNMTDVKWRKMLSFLKQYLAMEEWFHCENAKDEVWNARRNIGIVLKTLQELFPRKDGTNGYNIPKMHGMTKIQYYMVLFGSAMNFFGGPGESSHKEFVKAPGLKTQRRIGEFAQQTAKQYHHMMMTRHAATCMRYEGLVRVGDLSECSKKQTERKPVMDGKYEIDATEEILTELLSSHMDNQINRLGLHRDLIRVIHRDRNLICGTNGQKTTITGFTRAGIYGDDGNKTLYYAHPRYRGTEWYDWGFIHFDMSCGDESKEHHYPAHILGFLANGDEVEAVVQCSEQPLKWSTVERNFLAEFTLCDKFPKSFVRVPLTSIVFPLCVVKNFGGNNKTYFVVLPKRRWGAYFANIIKPSK